MLKYRIRQLLHRLLCLALRWRSRSGLLEIPGKSLVIAPHQDDEALGCGGYISRRRLAALPVEVLYITDGSASHPGHPTLTPEELAARRRAESLQAMQLLGVEPSALHFLGVADGTLGQLDSAGVEALTLQIAEIFQRLRPSEILLPCRRDGSSEHEAVFSLVGRSLVLAAIEPRVLEYPVWARWNPLRLIRPLVGSRRVWRVAFSGSTLQKQQALATYVTQAEPTPPWLEPVLPRGFFSFFASAEEFFFEN